jgi:hypothetical protein
MSCIRPVRSAVTAASNAASPTRPSSLALSGFSNSSFSATTVRPRVVMRRRRRTPCGAVAVAV